ncbi:MAG TPA: F0F1 ATP synthase subunit B [Cyclobacteriaceae bacterium]
MELLTPGIGLIFWQTVVFLILLFILTKFVWKPVSSALRAREKMIEENIKAAEIARDEVEQIKSDNEALLDEARKERDEILKEATAAANQIRENAKAETSTISEKMIKDARVNIENEKNKALEELKDLVATLSLEISEKLLREKLKEDDAQRKLIDKLMKDIKIN